MLTELFIGKKIRVVSSTNKTVFDMSGVVVDETQYTFVVQTERGTKRILKRSCIFECEGKKFAGKDIEKQSFERLKK